MTRAADGLRATTLADRTWPHVRDGGSGAVRSGGDAVAGASGGNADPRWLAEVLRTA